MKKMITKTKIKVLRYKITVITSILVGNAIGVCIPILEKRIPALHLEKNVFFGIKTFAVEMILTTGFIHVLLDFFESLTSPCLSVNPWTNFPFIDFVEMLSVVGTLMVATFATTYKKAQPSVGKHEDDVDTHASHGLAHGSSSSDEEMTIIHCVISYVILVSPSIVAHSVIIGISLGASDSLKTIRPLVATLTFRQFFEEMGLARCIVKVYSIKFNILTFSCPLTTPIGITIISKVYNEYNFMVMVVEGIFNASIAKILIYMALVDLLDADLMNPNDTTKNKHPKKCMSFKIHLTIIKHLKQVYPKKHL
ncbi:hypothetical protein PVL29_003857 [Vitis rotundifolia]|uniref:Uncharacterized protein n=1 Tax=Vitis rotundifolia TaxID=103349 RepID=A0AA39AE46_VITRO|nr:hypothetical protein PVL29_003857 [Vitis rotundifolia]